jgi:hypothetical protein
MDLLLTLLIIIAIILLFIIIYLITAPIGFNDKTYYYKKFDEWRQKNVKKRDV